MALPVIAAGVARITAVGGRTAVSAGRTASVAGKSTSSATRSYSQMKSQFQQARALNERFGSTKTQNNEEDEDESGLPANSRLRQLQEAQQQMQKIVSSKMNQFKIATSMMRTFNSLKAVTAEEAKPTQDAAKKAVKTMIPKATMWLANAVCSALELGTGGVALIVTFLIRLITLGWYNLEMIYGGWIMKGKHLIVGSLTWDPIPIPFPKPKNGANATSLTIIVIILDLFVAIMILMSLTILMLPLILLGALVSWAF